MVISLSLVFFGVKSYRDNQQNGSITFGRAFKVGALIALVASIIYCLSWEVAYNTVCNDIMERAAQYEHEKLKNSGASETEQVKASEEFQKIAEAYKNPFIRFAFTLMEISPVALVISLISAALLRKKEFLPAA